MAKSLPESGPFVFHLVKDVLDACRPRGNDMKYCVCFTDGDKLWLPESCFNEAAQTKFITAELQEQSHEVPDRRSR